MSKNKNIFSLSAFLNEVQILFNKHISDKIYIIKAEINKIKLIKSYFYFDLVELDENGKIVSKIKGTLFTPREMRNFLDGVGITDYNDLIGKKLVMHGKANFHKDYGFSFNIATFDVEYFLGDAQVQKQNILKKLEEKGLLHRNKNLNYSFPPFNIAVISSQNSEGLKDFITILSDSKINYNIEYFYSSIHGDRSIPEILNAIKDIKKEDEKYIGTNISKLDGKEHKYDFVAIIRGGGGSEGMNWANNEKIGESLAGIDIPIITAIGHTNDTSILDMISKYSAKTPSEGAKIIIDISNIYLDKINFFNENIKNLLSRKSSFYNIEIKEIYNEILSNIQSKNFYLNNSLQKNFNLINSSIISKTHLYKLKLQEFKSSIQTANLRISNYRKELDFLNNQIKSSLKSQLKNLFSSISSTYQIIKGYNYDNILKKGFSLTIDKKTGKVVNELSLKKNYDLKNKSGVYEIFVESKVEN